MKELDQNNFDEYIRAANTPVLADFWASWCGPCRAVTPALARIAQQYEGRLEVVKVNVEKWEDAFRRFNFHGIPALIVFKAGREAGRLLGAHPESAIRNMIESALVGTSSAPNAPGSPVPGGVTSVVGPPTNRPRIKLG